MSAEEQRSLKRCLNRIDDNRDLTRSAQCLIRSRERYQNAVPSIKSRLPPEGRRRWIGGFRMSRARLNRYRHRQRRHISSTLFHRQEIVKVDDREVSAKPKRVDSYKKMEKTAVSKVVNLIARLIHNGTNDIPDDLSRWTKLYHNLLTVKKSMDEKKESPGAKVYEKRMYDLVLGRERPSMTRKQSKTPAGLFQIASQLFSGLNATERSRSNIKFLSPRFAAVMPDKTETEAEASQLSPTIFSFYENSDNSSTNLASIPWLLKAAGLTSRDRDAVLGLLLQLTGATDVIGDATDLLKELNFSDIQSDIANATQTFDEVYDTLKQSFNEEQKRELSRKGFTFMESHQLHKFYRDEGMRFPEDSFDFDGYRGLDRQSRIESLWLSVERIARDESLEDFKLYLNSSSSRRSRRQVNVLAPSVLTTFAFQYSTGLTVLGPVIMGPTLFTAVVQSPSVLSPGILQPGLGYPFILSPYLLSPFILSPFMMAPFILTPYVLSPNVMSPFMLSPAILSPTVLSPDVLSPMALGGGILSPSVGSPAVFTVSSVMVSILSPSFLS